MIAAITVNSNCKDENEDEDEGLLAGPNVLNKSIAHDAILSLRVLEFKSSFSINKLPKAKRK